MVSINVGILGATGIVGQRIASLLVSHPWFKLAAVSGGERNYGKSYAAVLRDGGEGLPASIRDLRVSASDPAAFADCRLVFSALPNEAASDIEPAFAAAGHAVVSNARSYRMEADVPLVIPEINPEHLKVIDEQQRRRGWAGYIVANPNCVAAHLALALAPIHSAFGLRQVQVTTLQAVSGAGYGGVDALSIIDNVIPYISGEEEKLEIEPRKLLGGLNEDETSITLADFAVSATCTRVPVLDGHLETVSVSLAQPATEAALTAAWQGWQPLADAGLPSAPAHPTIYRPESNRPQSRLDRDVAGGMASVIGRLRPCPLLDYKFVTLGHNLVRGAAGGVVILAELLHRVGRV